jgi:uncharacterized protein YbjT (DUF2867 family)
VPEGIDNSYREVPTGRAGVTMTVPTDGISVVAGSLGDQGGAVARALRESMRRVRALSHNVTSKAASQLRGLGVEVVDDDLNAVEAVRRDLAGAGEVFGALTPFDEGGPAAQERQVRNLAAAALATGVDRFVYSGVGDPVRDREAAHDHLWDVERLLREADLPLTLVRPAFFMENLEEFALCWGDGGGLEVRMPLDPDLELQWIALEDVGVLGRLAFGHPEIFGDEPMELAGDQLRLSEACALLSDVLGVEVRYVRIPFEEVREQSEHAYGMYQWFEAYAQYDADIRHLRELHPGMLTFEAWLRRGYLDFAKLDR